MTTYHSTAAAAYENWYVCFEEGRWTAARKWWAIYHSLVNWNSGVSR